MSDTDAFWTAVKGGDAAQVQAQLAAEPALAAARTAGGVSAALLAVYYGHAAVGRQIVAARGNADLFEAAALGLTERVAEVLAAAPGEANAFAADGFTPLGLACYFGQPAVADQLLAAGADPNLAARNAMRVAPIHSAVANQDAAVALTITTALLAHGAQVNVGQEGDYTPLHETAFHGVAALTDLLLRHGADPRAPTSEGVTPLALAEKHGHAEIAARLRGA